MEGFLDIGGIIFLIEVFALFLFLFVFEGFPYGWVAFSLKDMDGSAKFFCFLCGSLAAFFHMSGSPLAYVFGAIATGILFLRS